LSCTRDSKQLVTVDIQERPWRGPPRSGNSPSKLARRHQNLGRDNEASSRYIFTLYIYIFTLYMVCGLPKETAKLVKYSGREKDLSGESKPLSALSLLHSVRECFTTALESFPGWGLMLLLQGGGEANQNI
jgi:hypothetical protein